MALQRLNIEQERAKAAFEYAEGGKSKNGYDSYAKKIPMYILNNGLLNTIAFATSKSKDPAWQKLVENITDWLKNKDKQELIKNKFTDDKNIMQVLLSLNDSELRQVTNEVLALFSWLRRFVKED